MRTLFVCCSVVLLLLVGCSISCKGNLSNSGADASKDARNPLDANSAKKKGDFSTPKAAVETFISAGAKKDIDLLSRCFHPESPGEFRKLREKTSTAKDLDELSTFVEGAIVGDSQERGDSALVKVAFKKRNEEITMKKLEGDWKILDF